MRRNVFNVCDTVRSNHDKLKNNEKNSGDIMQMLREIKHEIAQFSYHIKMDSVDMSDFFPLKSNADLKRFIDKSHDEWPQRRKGFQHLLYTTVTKTKRRFAAALLHVLFSREFIFAHKWPYTGYIFFCGGWGAKLMFFLSFLFF